MDIIRLTSVEGDTFSLRLIVRKFKNPGNGAQEPNGWCHFPDLEILDVASTHWYGLSGNSRFKLQPCEREELTRHLSLKITQNRLVDCRQIRFWAFPGPNNEPIHPGSMSDQTELSKLPGYDMWESNTTHKLIPVPSGKPVSRVKTPTRGQICFETWGI